MQAVSVGLREHRLRLLRLRRSFRSWRNCPCAFLEPESLRLRYRHAIGYMAAKMMNHMRVDEEEQPEYNENIHSLIETFYM
jgi:hypothetical protein